MDRWKIAWEIYGALRLAGEDIDDASVPIIGKVLGEYIEDEVPGAVALREAAPLLMAACEAIQEAFARGEIKFTKIRQADSDPYHPANVKLCAAIAAAKGEK